MTVDQRIITIFGGTGRSNAGGLLAASVFQFDD